MINKYVHKVYPVNLTWQIKPYAGITHARNTAESRMLIPGTASSTQERAHRQIRKDVKDRWRSLLENLGFHNEADSLLTVTSNHSYNSMRDPTEARRLLNQLAQETSIFEQHNLPPPERYLFVLDRLIVLDTGTEFVSIARQFYPPETLDSNEKESVGLGTAVLVSPGQQKVENGEDKEEEECVEVDEESFLVNLTE
ncbi:melanoregulin-like isoform X2 [Dendrobates tinctorius]|uniref:melanoregulin-like isoform X2 n=1 Tax=Dendrobates tinctorius TaxID=92724 RepID=UPI003CCA6A5B